MNVNRFKELPIMGILRGITKEQLTPLLETSLRAGLTTFEITLNTRHALELISYTAKTFQNNIMLGAGTVLTLQEAEAAMAAGASFIVAPNFNSDIAQFCTERKIPFFPGALTPSEIYTAWNAGATMVKVFPASLFGPKYFREIKAPLSQVELMAVSGVTPEASIEYLKNGANAFAIGASVFRKDLMESSLWKQIQDQITLYIKNYRIFRQGDIA